MLWRGTPVRDGIREVNVTKLKNFSTRNHPDLSGAERVVKAFLI